VLTREGVCACTHGVASACKRAPATRPYSFLSCPVELAAFVCVCVYTAFPGVVHQLLEQLSPQDPLSSLVALQLLQVSVLPEPRVVLEASFYRANKCLGT
jgi:hypothetical protein